MEIEKLKEELQILIDNGNQIDITPVRGRLIKAYQKEIKKLSKNPYLTEDEKGKLEAYKLELEEETIKHKIQLSARYKNEFLEKKATPSTIVTTLPKAISLSAKKVATCIKDIKNGKNLKEKLKKTLDTAKALGLLVATPAIYVGKFLVDQWYILAGAIGAAYIFDKFYGNNRDTLYNLFKNSDKGMGKIMKGFARTLGLGDQYATAEAKIDAVDNAYNSVHGAIDKVNNGISNIAEKIRGFSGDLRHNVSDRLNSLGIGGGA